MKHYTEDRGYKTINASLRSGEPTPAAAQLLDDIRNAPKSPGSVARGLILGPKQAAQFKEGAELTAKGMWSSTTDKQVAQKFNKIQKIPGAAPKVAVMLYIEHKSGVDVSELSKFPAEKEVIIPHGVNFHINKVKHLGKSVQVYLSEVSS